MRVAQAAATDNMMPYITDLMFLHHQVDTVQVFQAAAHQVMETIKHCITDLMSPHPQVNTVQVFQAAAHRVMETIKHCTDILIIPLVILHIVALSIQVQALLLLIV